MSIRILAGPLLRRIEPSRVCVWIATSVSVRIKGLIFDADDLVNGYLGQRKTSTVSIGEGGTTSYRLGKGLHISLVQILPRTKLGVKAFQSDTTLAYDLELAPADSSGAGANLGAFFPREGPDRIVYAPNRLPTFVIRTTLPAHFLHGSCRKPHGNDVDGLAVVDEILGAAIPEIELNKPYTSNRTLRERPGTLLLTGDQIYADDVAEALIDHLAALGREIMGFDEKLPAIDRPEPTTAVGSLVCGARGRLVNAKVRGQPLFTSTEARNHLLAFGDFAAMYLLAWSPECWPKELPSSPRCRSFNPSGPSGPERRFDQDRRALESFRETLPKARRALANISCYMTFDDHDITDDWNITAQWRNNIAGSPLGTRIVTNGLTAFWAFQGLGNHPDRFSEDFIRTVEQSLRGEQADTSALQDRLKQVGDWGLILPGKPCIVMLDERTRRAYDTDTGPARRIGPGGLKSIQDSVRNVLAPNEPLVLVAPGPVLGIPLIEFLQEQISKGSYERTVENDLESWHANLRGFLDLLRSIEACHPRGCLILSGDVHYGYVARGDFETVIHGESPLHVVQFTSSALKNPTKGFKVANPKVWAFLDAREESLVFWMMEPQTKVPLTPHSTSLRYDAPGLPLVLNDNSAERTLVATPPDYRLRAERLGPDGQEGTIEVTTSSNIGRVRIRSDLSALLSLLVCDGSPTSTEELVYGVDLKAGLAAHAAGVGGRSL